MERTAPLKVYVGARCCSRMRLRGGVALALVVVALGLPPVSAQSPLEIDVLEEYLEAHDRYPNVPHCARHDGSFGFPGQQGVDTPAATNDILFEHKQWHHENGFGMDVSPDESDRTGDAFVSFHRAFLEDYEAWRNQSGYPPVVAWNPADPQPSTLDYPFPERACNEQETETRVALPGWLNLSGGTEPDSLYGYESICQFQDLNQLGKSVRSSYHITVHQTYGELLQQDPRDPWFWSFHKFLDGQFILFETQCLPPADQPRPDVEGNEHQASAPGFSLAGAAVVAAMLGRRGAR